MKKLAVYILLTWIIGSCQQHMPKDQIGEVSNVQFSGNSDYQLIWAEEFNSTGGLDSSKWSYHTGDGCPHLCGWGNNELQYYSNRSKNLRLEEGKLILEAHKEDIHGRNFSSAKVLTKNKADWTYGKILIKAKLPKGRGTWPAIWMLPTLDRPISWPLDGEIDIMEHVGFDQGTIHGTVHTEAYNGMIGTQQSGNIILDDASEVFHEYGVEWTAEKIIWLVDGKAFFQLANPKQTAREWPFDKPFHLILNLAVGGNWGGEQGVAENIWPQRMEIDYVRVYQKAPQMVANTQ